MITEVGAHRVSDGGASLATARALMPAPRMANLVYTDPPWGPSALHMFDTMNATEYQDWDGFLKTWAEAVDYAAAGRVCVYMGSKNADDVTDVMRKRGLYRVAEDILEYGGLTWWETLGRKARLKATMLQYDRDRSAPPIRWTNPVHGRHAVLDAIGAILPGSTIHRGLVYDPCVGLGLVAKVSIQSGCLFVGSDLNATRLATTIDILQKTRQPS